MIVAAPKQFAVDEADLDAQRLTLKSVQCPHCRQFGYLIGHGFLRGYSESGEHRVIRGRRFFCSNRYRRSGCGLTFSILLAQFLRRFVVGASTLLRFVEGVAGGGSRTAAWTDATNSFSWRSAYRVWLRFCHAQSHIKTRLCRVVTAPPSSSSRSPIAQLLSHLQAVLPVTACVFAGFQYRCQTGLLP